MRELTEECRHLLRRGVISQLKFLLEVVTPENILLVALQCPQSRSISFGLKTANELRLSQNPTRLSSHICHQLVMGRTCLQVQVGIERVERELIVVFGDLR